MPRLCHSVLWTLSAAAVALTTIGSVALAQECKAKAWQRLERLPQYEILTEPRTKRERIKEQIVRQKGYRPRSPAPG